MKAKGDHSKKVGAAKGKAMPKASKRSMAKKPKGRPVVMPGGAKTYHNR